MTSNVFIAFLLLICFPAVIFTEIYSSIQSIHDAWVYEREVLVDAKEFLEGLNRSNLTSSLGAIRLDGFISFVNTTLEVHSQFEDELAIARYLKHPFHIYHFIKRCVEDWTFHGTHFLHMDDVINDFKFYLDRMHEYFLWPVRADLTAASLGIVRLQRAYLFDFNEMATGSVKGFSSEPLTVEDMYDIGLVALDNWQPAAIVWLTAAGNLLQAGEIGGLGATSYAKVTLKVAEAYEKFGDYKLAADTADGLLKLQPQNDYIQEQVNYFRNMNETNPSEELAPLLEKDSTIDSYLKLCRGEVPKKADNVANQLYCFHQASAIPYRRTKVEIVNIDPHIYVFHDVIYEGEQAAIKEMVKDRLDRSTITAGNDERRRVAEYRISRTAWLSHDEDDVVVRLYNRVHQVTGFTVARGVDGVSGSEELQVVNYGIGGLYGPHFDFMKEYPDDLFTLEEDDLGPGGDRIATWMFYLNDVEYGGATVFPEAGARVPNLRGSAVLWYDLNRDGTPDRRTLHAGCPVAIGSKWIGNIWIRYIPQAMSKPCLLNNQQAL